MCEHLLLGCGAIQVRAERGERAQPCSPDVVGRGIAEEPGQDEGGDVGERVPGLQTEVGLEGVSGCWKRKTTMRAADQGNIECDMQRGSLQTLSATLE